MKRDKENEIKKRMLFQTFVLTDYELPAVSLSAREN